MKPSKVNIDLYTNFLIATQKQYSCTELEQVSPVDYRIYNREEDSKTKNDHFLEMLNACEEKGLEPSYTLFDSWFASQKNLKTVARKG
ncbi:MAG: hypothetical protein HRT47_08015 [Candidatus Caenarcaniphilales bacterium]|nr:hypothetical protein [Candidatus Caenarcaniphilales bacterium]